MLDQILSFEDEEKQSDQERRVTDSDLVIAYRKSRIEHHESVNLVNCLRQHLPIAWCVDIRLSVSAEWAQVSELFLPGKYQANKVTKKNVNIDIHRGPDFISFVCLFAP